MRSELSTCLITPIQHSMAAELQSNLRKLSNQYWAENHTLFCHLETLLAWFYAQCIPTKELHVTAPLSAWLSFFEPSIRP
jgi:hypothetical protein